MQAYPKTLARSFEIENNIDNKKGQIILDRYHSELDVVFDNCRGAMLIASRPFEINETIVSALTCRVPHQVREKVRSFDFYKYFFVKAEDFRNSVNCCDAFIAFGPMSFCNHSETPNAEVVWETINDRTVLHLTARENVRARTEITMSYANLPEYIGSDNWK